MYAKQYEVTLPADYDMQVVRKRVAAVGPLLDDRAGLGLKAYAIRERGSGGSPVNQYAPFYLWNDTGAMAHFLVGRGGFENVIRSFGRPAVHHWTGVAALPGPARDAVPSAASRRLTTLPADPYPHDTGLGLAERIDREVKQLGEIAARDGVHTAALALDPCTWRLVRFVLGRDGALDDEATERYEVLHVSAPGLAGLPHGRAW
jgi:hypothetical protein